MRLLYFISSILILLLFSCSAETEKNVAKNNEETKDSIDINGDDTLKKNTDESNSSPASVADIDNWISQITKTDTIGWNGVYTDEYNETKDIKLYMATSGDYHHATIDLPETVDGRSYISYYFDKKMDLCRMDIIEVRNGQWHDQISQLYYFEKGNPIWFKSSHVYKVDVIADTAYAPGPLTDDEHIIFYTTNDIDDHVTKR